ncbi:hypothetical protein TRFO_37954 [Tritrichomonas foetus]|uniref:DUF3447 domain-containing protein n=1 Tax=Tritrichomonas foetus TaxID=1144522 RepID=A0A1J4J9U3_9EUKA|nr:hypothetical protein TRFO_37954 [Tritrichomonas foetus]|eukprot:OHS95928.1 hypothetical protein TRFO_37954 [Tritrichomonas foetus]
MITQEEESRDMSMEALQKVLFDLNEANTKASIHTIINSVYMSSTKHFKLFFKQLIKTIPFRPELMDLYVDFFIEILEQSTVAKDSVSLSLGIDSLLEISCIQFADLLNPICCFYSKLEEKNVFRFEEYAKQFFDTYMVEVWRVHIIATSRLFHWFAEKFLSFEYPEWKRPEEFSKMYFNNYSYLEIDVKNIIDHMYFSAETYNYFNFQEMWTLNEPTKAYIRKFLADALAYHNDATDAIMKDDIDLLQSCVSESLNFNLNGNVRCYLFNNNMMLFNNPVNYKHYYPKRVRFVQLAALYQSINCFKYLVMNNCDLKDTMQYAIAGGNIEIIRHVENSIPEGEAGNKEWELAALMAIKYHRNNVLEWIFETKNTTFIANKDIRDMADFFNAWAYNFILEKLNQTK